MFQPTTTTIRPPAIFIESPCPICGCTHSHADQLMLATVADLADAGRWHGINAWRLELHDLLLWQSHSAAVENTLTMLYHAVCRFQHMDDANGHGEQPAV